jgi:RimJ/RimL family protein N-acetyltransferase
MRGRGIASEMLSQLISFAFEELRLHRLELIVFSFNEPALRCYRRLGFAEEGLARHARKASTGYWDVVYMGLLESDFRANTTE